MYQLIQYWLKEAFFVTSEYSRTCTTTDMSNITITINGCFNKSQLHYYFFPNKLHQDGRHDIV